MSQRLHECYNSELNAITTLAKEFSERYPAVAGRLGIESGDPHVERLLQGFALLAGRVRMKLDDDFPELTDALLNILYPHYLAPVPSCAVMQFEADPTRTPLNDGFLIPRGGKLFTAALEDGTCRYRTVYPVRLWPIVISDCRLQGPAFPAGLRPPPGTTAILRINLVCEAGATFSKLSIQDLPLHLADNESVAAELYELLLNQVLQAEAHNPDRPGVPLPLPRTIFEPIGFEGDEGLLPYPPQSFPGYRLLTELFAFPAKFWFVKLLHLNRLVEAGYGSKANIIVYLKRSTANLEAAVTVSSLRAGCTPIVNLFEHTAETIPFTQRTSEFAVEPDVAHPLGYEVYSINEVTGVDPTAGINTVYRPFYSVNHVEGRGKPEAYWYSTRKNATRKVVRSSGAHVEDQGTDVYLQLVDRGWTPLQPAISSLVVQTTCTNRNLPVALSRLGERLRMDLEMKAPLKELRCVRAPTIPLRPPRRRGAHWRLLSHLSLNHLSIAEGDEARLAFQELLRLYDFSDAGVGQQLSDVNRLLVDGLAGLSSRRIVGRVDDPVASGFCRGTEITVLLDEEKYVGVGAYLFASVLERFMALYASLNSFTQLIAKSQDGKSLLKAWPPRAGAKPLV